MAAWCTHTLIAFTCINLFERNFQYLLIYYFKFSISFHHRLDSPHRYIVVHFAFPLWKIRLPDEEQKLPACSSLFQCSGLACLLLELFPKLFEFLRHSKFHKNSVSISFRTSATFQVFFIILSLYTVRSQDASIF